LGTDAWRNWRAFNDGEQELENFDDELQSDVQFFGGTASFGPYRLSTVFRRPGAVGPAVIVYGGVHTDLMPKIIIDGELTKTNMTAYHGGTMTDEIAALISLELGVRVRLAGTLRLSGIHDQDDPNPPLYFEVPRLAQPGLPHRERVPRAVTRSADLSTLSRLASFPTLDEAKQVELVRVARSYATGLWWANEDPNQAWLQLVTAVETAATGQKITADPAALIEETWPELWAPLQSTDEPARKKIAKLLAPQVKATRKFIDFVTTYAPPPPDARPAFSSLNWDEMPDHARKIYGHRSKALHEGRPFPMPMLEEPRSEGPGIWDEIPGGLNAGGLGGVWMADDTPMLLSTFEYIARGALLRWWDDLVSAANSSYPTELPDQ
jgi:hypothetical protein